MTAATLPCPTCACTGEDTHEDRHAGTNQDTCRMCGGTGFIPARTGETAEASFRPYMDEQSRQFIEESDRIEAEELSRRARVLEPGQRAYLARWEGHTLGPSGASPAWEDLQPCAREIWARVERACAVPAGAMRDTIVAACFDPGILAGARGARTTDEWRADAVLAVLSGGVDA